MCLLHLRVGASLNDVTCNQAQKRCFTRIAAIKVSHCFFFFFFICIEVKNAVGKTLFALRGHKKEFALVEINVFCCSFFYISFELWVLFLAIFLALSPLSVLRCYRNQNKSKIFGNQVRNKDRKRKKIKP